MPPSVKERGLNHFYPPVVLEELLELLELLEELLELLEELLELLDVLLELLEELLVLDDGPVPAPMMWT
jgi:hypothetical protein